MADQQQQQQQQQYQHFYQQYGQQHHQHNRSFDMQQGSGQQGTPKGSPSFLPVLASGPPNAIPVATSLGSSSAFSSSTTNPAAASSSSTSWHPTQQQQQGSSSGGAGSSNNNTRLTPRDRQSSISYHNNSNMITHDTPLSASSGHQQGGGGSGSDSYNHSNMNNGGSSTASTSQVAAVAAGSQNSKNAPKRAIQSCAECKRRKIKCDRVYPCSPCKLRGEEALCREVEKQEPIHMPVPTMMDFEAACARISHLEDMMTTLQKLVTYQGQQTQQLQQAQHVQAQQHNRISAGTGGLGGSGEPTSPRRAIGYKTGNALAIENSRTASPAGFDDSRKNPPPPLRNFEEVVRQGKPGERDHEDMAMMLEDFAMNNRQNREKAAKLMGAPDGSIGVPTDAPLPSPVRGINGAMKDPMAALSNFINPADFTSAQHSSASSSVEFIHPLAGITNPSTDYLAKFFSQAPDAVRGWQLVQFYFTHLEWYSRVLHAPTFLAECRNLLSLPINAVSSRVRPAFLATYFMVLCLALQFIEEQDRMNLGLTAEEAQTYCTNMFTAVQGLLHLCDFMGHHSLEHLQIISLMGVYQYNTGEADSHWALLGSAIKIAQNIGMSRLGSERADMKWPEAWQNPLKREIGRRVWWNMIFLDWSLATAHNACYSIHPAQNFTDFPANVDDNDIQDNQPINARPLDQHTDTSFTICRLKFVALYRELVDHHITHPSPSYTFILEMDTRIVNLLDSLPPYFRGATPPAEHINDSKVMECLLIQLIGETRLLRLHRPYLSRGYRDRKYAPSKERCVNSARSILVLLKTAEKASPILLGQWLTLFYGFGAAVVTFIDLCHGKATDSEASTREKRQHVSEMISLLKSAKHVSDAARRATQLLEGLLAAEEDCPAWPNFLGSSNIGQKRKLETLDDPDPFRRTVKKLLLDASTKTGSASQTSPGSSTGLPQQSPTIFSQAGSADNRSLPTFSGYASNQPVRPPPFLPDLDLFMESSGKYSHFSKPTPVFANEEPVDSTSADLSHLFVDDILSNLFTTDPLGGQDMAFGGSGW